MKALLHHREKCKYDFIVISDDNELLKIYEEMYHCEPIETCLRQTIATEEDFRKIHETLTRIYIKKFCCICYSQKTYAVFSILPEDRNIQKNELRIHNKTNILQIIEDLMYMTLTPKDGILALHGAAVAKENKAFLFLAKTTAGKSTLAAFLWLSGYEYITDDEIFLSQKDLCVEPARKTLSLRPGGYKILQEIFKTYDTPLNKAKNIIYGNIDRYLLPAGEKTRYGQYEIGGIVFLEEYASKTPSLKKINAFDAFPKLLKGQLSATQDQRVEAKYKTLAQLANNTYEMRYSDLWTAETYLEHLQI